MLELFIFSHSSCSIVQPLHSCTELNTTQNVSARYATYEAMAATGQESCALRMAVSSAAGTLAFNPVRPQVIGYH